MRARASRSPIVTTVEKSEMVTKAIGGIRVSRPLRRVLRPTVDQESRPARVSSSTRPSAASLQSAIASVLPLPEAPTIISQSGSSSQVAGDGDGEHDGEHDCLDGVEFEVAADGGEHVREGRLVEFGRGFVGERVFPPQRQLLAGFVTLVYVGDELGELLVVERVDALVLAVVLGDERGDGRLFGEAAPPERPGRRDHRVVPGAVADYGWQRVGCSVLPLLGVGEQPPGRVGELDVVGV